METPSIEQTGFSPDLSVPQVYAWSATPRPAVRLFARTFDNILIIGPLFVLLERNGISVDGMTGTFAAACGVLFLAFIESLLLPLYGTTPGKWLLRTRVVANTGSSSSTAEEAPLLDFNAGIRRSFLVAVVGAGLNFSYLTTILAVLAARRLRNQGATYWDDKSGSTVLHSEIGAPRIALFCVLITLLCGAMVMLMPDTTFSR